MLSVNALSNRSHDQVVTVIIGRPSRVGRQQTQQESIYGALPHGRTIIMGRRASPADCASYLRGSGTRELLFRYQVQPEDFDANGIRLALGMDTSGFCRSGSITGEGTQVQASPWYRGTGHQSGHRIDTAPPAVREINLSSRPADGEAYTAFGGIGDRAGNNASVSHTAADADATQRVAA